MSTLEDQVVALTAAVTSIGTNVVALQATVAALPVSQPVDLKPVLDGLAAIQAQFALTPPAAAAPAASA